MALALTSGFDLILKWLYTNPLDISTPTDQVRLTFSDTLTDGTGLDQANRIFHDERSILTTANDDLDLAGGLVDPFGITLTFAKIRTIFIKNLATTAGGKPHDWRRHESVCFMAARNDSASLTAWTRWFVSLAQSIASRLCRWRR